ncbi:magnesium transporter NIPA-domain-containing protein [Cantharellus anzutake]|uniref:magnesium transporter NIPA-domain-containing protein n=1 Tax=Cantharellus anzutake TaxID=1750568 RepID=UPI0019063CBA|nr:magnesium transporter NIPA-domain-containing protein [Cantharellus anzutake]KAF8329425.1 magnesium transporter NIPA-domain-containing protein [Cantharellus anzutake]
MEGKYVGLLLALSGTIGIGSSFIIIKKGLNDAALKSSSAANASDNLSYLRNPIWWAGIVTIANFAAYAFAPPILVTPLGALSVLIGAILASLFLGEELGHLGRVGCTLCLLGSLIIILHAPEDKEVQTVDEILHFAIQPGFLLYCFTVLIFTLVMVYRVSPRYGKKSPLVYISICSLVGSISIMAIKGFGIAIKLTWNGNNQLTHPSTYVFAIVVAVCIMVQMTYFNKALDTFSTNVVNPIYYVGFSSATIIASLILFRGFNTSDHVNIVSLIAGFIVTFLGVHLLNLSRKPDPPPLGESGHTLLEGGLMNPRVSVTARLSVDSNWSAHGGPPWSAGHGRRSSLYRSQDAQLHSAFDDEGVGLELLKEEDEEEGGTTEQMHITSGRPGDRDFPLRTLNGTAR